MNLHTPAQLLLGPLAETARVSPVGPHQLQPGELPFRALRKQASPAVPIREVGAVHARGQDEPVGVHQDVTLSPRKTLRPIVAPRSGPPARLVLTAWLSITAALGSRARPSRARTSARSASCALRSRLSKGHLRK